MKKKTLELIQGIQNELIAVCDSERVAHNEAWWMLEKITGQVKPALLAYKHISLTQEQEQTLEQWVKQRVQDKKPLQYILGSVLFCGCDIFVESPVLIPRPETEEMVTWLIDKINELEYAHGSNTHEDQGGSQQELNILDLCSGSGCISIALARAFKDAHIIGLDISEQAIALANKNKAHNNVKNVTFAQSDLYGFLSGDQKFDVIISNPPYLSDTCYEHVSDEIKLWEDKQALVTGNNGMAIYERIIKQAREYLKDQKQKYFQKNNKLPEIILEIGVDQSTIETLFSGAGFEDVRVYKDMAGMRRWVTARLK